MRGLFFFSKLTVWETNWFSDKLANSFCPNTTPFPTKLFDRPLHEHCVWFDIDMTFQSTAVAWLPGEVLLQNHNWLHEAKSGVVLVLITPQRRIAITIAFYLSASKICTSKTSRTKTKSVVVISLPAIQWNLRISRRCVASVTVAHQDRFIVFIDWGVDVVGLSAVAVIVVVVVAIRNWFCTKL